MALGISIREFARRDGCSDMLVRKAIKAGRLHTLPDGTLDPQLVGSGWRKANRRRRQQPKVPPPPADLQKIADQAVRVEGRAPYSLAEAERIKTNYLAMLRQLQFDRESGSVVEIEAVGREVEREYTVVRERLLTIPGKVAALLVGCDRAAIELRLADEITEALEDLAYRSPAASES